MDQDWKSVNIGNKKKSIVKHSKENKNRNSGQKLFKLDTTEIGPIKKVTLSTRKAISQRRTYLKLSQKEFAQKLNCKPEIITSYENGKAIPNQNILIKMERILGIYLSGKLVGEVKSSKK